MSLLSRVISAINPVRWLFGRRQPRDRLAIEFATDEETSTKTPGDCEASDTFVPPEFGVPGIGAKLAELKAHFGAASGSKIAYRADRPGGYSDIAQYLGYMLKGGTVSGIGVGETSIPTAH